MLHWPLTQDTCGTSVNRSKQKCKSKLALSCSSFFVAAALDVYLLDLCLWGSALALSLGTKPNKFKNSGEKEKRQLETVEN